MQEANPAPTDTRLEPSGGDLRMDLGAGRMGRAVLPHATASRRLSVPLRAIPPRDQ
ncbi:hypothetical protein RR42_m3011 [Cupriavidus basilensis]|uniref:Uncharacterized protein n=1 Tax=Cupriavidus basilensis TaxID=68895 RepID=A0A0C4Y4S4_9BURK|nr:hypothetical protein RR42_m3011 [Cupriavidus basilensis]